MAKAVVRRQILAPKDMEELLQFVGLIRRAERIISEIEAECNREIAELEEQIEKLKKEAKQKAAAHEKEINLLGEGVHLYAEVHREELTKEKAKTVELATGDVLRWYLSKPSVRYEDEKAAIKELEQKKLMDAVRIIKEINKEYILSHPEVIKGLKNLSIGRYEIFAIDLVDLGVELQKGKGKRKFKKVAR